MLPKSQFVTLAILSAIIGGCALVGMFVLAFTVYALTQGAVEPMWVVKLLFGTFVVGAFGALGTLWLTVRSFQKNVIRQLGLDK